MSTIDFISQEINSWILDVLRQNILLNKRNDACIDQEIKESKFYIQPSILDFIWCTSRKKINHLPSHKPISFPFADHSIGHWAFVSFAYRRASYSPSCKLARPAQKQPETRKTCCMTNTQCKKGNFQVTEPGYLMTNAVATYQEVNESILFLEFHTLCSWHYFSPPWQVTCEIFTEMILKQLSKSHLLWSNKVKTPASHENSKTDTSR